MEQSTGGRRPQGSPLRDQNYYGDKPLHYQLQIINYRLQILNYGDKPPGDHKGRPYNLLVGVGIFGGFFC